MRRILYAIVFIVLLIVFSLIAVFVVVNTQPVALNVLIRNIQLPIGAVALLSLLLGALLTLIGFSGILFKSRLERGRLRRRLHAAEQNNQKHQPDPLAVNP